MSPPEILIIGVVYNTYPETLRYLSSIEQAMDDTVFTILVDNSDQADDPDSLKKIREKTFLHYIKTSGNLGYFGGAGTGLTKYLEMHPTLPKWILVTNVDIIFSPQFFAELKNINMEPGTGLIAPAIISHRWGSDYNPQRMKRYSRRQLVFYKILYSNLLIHNAYVMGSYLKQVIKGLIRFGKSFKGSRSHAGEAIYAPHGSCLIFTGHYFIRGGTLELPHFLFCEEIFTAEKAIESDLRIIYRPELVIHDFEHASTGFIISRKINRYHRQAIQAVLDKYYQ
jgi:GT2 family glycosyltransferase